MWQTGSIIASSKRTMLLTIETLLTGDSLSVWIDVMYMRLDRKLLKSRAVLPLQSSENSGNPHFA